MQPNHYTQLLKRWGLLKLPVQTPPTTAATDPAKPQPTHDVHEDDVYPESFYKAHK